MSCHAMSCTSHIHDMRDMHERNKNSSCCTCGVYSFPCDTRCVLLTAMCRRGVDGDPLSEGPLPRLEATESVHYYTTWPPNLPSGHHHVQHHHTFTPDPPRRRLASSLACVSVSVDSPRTSGRQQLSQCLRLCLHCLFPLVRRGVSSWFRDAFF